MTDFLLEWTVERGLESYDVLVVYQVSYWGDPGRFSGPPEHCYPPEPMEFNLTSVEIAPRPWAERFYADPGRGVVRNPRFALTDAEREAIYEHISMNPPEQPGPDPDDLYDARFEREEAAREAMTDYD